MNKIINEIGNRYGKLVVISQSNIKLPNRTSRVWVCQCDCGNTTLVDGGTLRQNRTKSCGCLRQTNKIGKRYGKLVVIERDKITPSHWVCLCDCGKRKSIHSNSLQLNGGTKSCGCNKQILEVIIGQRFHKLIVLDKVSNSINDWQCKCDCGKIIITKGYALLSGNKRTCGFSCKIPKGKPVGESSFNVLYGSYKKSARKRNVDWKISKDEFRNLTSSICLYCGQAPSQGVRKSTDLNGNYIYNGIDRVDNALGYVFSNCVPCCWQCNRAKHNMPQKDFQKWVQKIYKNWIG